MKRIQYDHYGDPEVMYLAPFDRPKAGPGDILVQVKAASINPVDWGIRRGKMKILTGSTFPRGMGKDFAGIVIELGDETSGWKVGDAVLGCVPWRRPGGSFAPWALVRGDDIVSKPEALSFAEAAALPTIGLTAWHGLVEQAALEQNQSILVNGAAGGVGHVAVQIARSRGARVTARVGARSFERMKAIGVDVILDYREPLPAALNRSFDVIFDCNGSIAFPDADRLLKRGGVLVDSAVTVRKFLRSIFLRRQKLAFGSVDQKTLLAVTDFAASGALKMNIGTEVPIEAAIPLISRLEGGESFDGKAVVTFD